MGRIISQDPLALLVDQDQLQIWSMRYVIDVYDAIYMCVCMFLLRNVCLKKYPHSLPKLLSSISWNNRSDVAQVLDLHHMLLLLLLIMH